MQLHVWNMIGLDSYYEFEGLRYKHSSPPMRVMQKYFLFDQLFSCKYILKL